MKDGVSLWRAGVHASEQCDFYTWLCRDSEGTAAIASIMERGRSRAKRPTREAIAIYLYVLSAHIQAARLGEDVDDSVIPALEEILLSVTAWNVRLHLRG